MPAKLNLDEICGECGHRRGQHYGDDCPVGPVLRDAHPVKRFRLSEESAEPSNPAEGAQESMSKPTALIGITGAALDSLCEKIAKLEKQVEELAVKLGKEHTHSAHLENQVEGLRAALRNVLTEAVILSENYLEAFNNQPDTVTIQGWDKARWRRALAAKKQAEAALATQLPTKKG